MYDLKVSARCAVVAEQMRSRILKATRRVGYDAAGMRSGRDA